MRPVSIVLMVLGVFLESAHSQQAETRPLTIQLTPSNAGEGELRRRSMFGAQLAPVTKEVQERLKLDGDEGVLLEQIFPGTSAADAEFKAGDVILAVDEVNLTGIPMFLEKVAQSRAGDVLVIELVRDGLRESKRVTLQEKPREKGDGYLVDYGAVTSRGVRLRTIITRPSAEGRHPAVMLLQGGHTCFAIETPVGRPASFTWIAADLTRHGYVTLRVERPGCGDSEGGPLKDVDFDTELEGYSQALRMLKQREFVDAENIFLFGHSMGGIMAPLMAAEVPVRGIAVFGTASGTWFESVFGQRRRLASLDGTNAADVDHEILSQARFWFPLLIERKTPREILEQHPELQDLGWVTNDDYVGDRHYLFHHQLADKNLTEAWGKVAATDLTNDEQAPLPEVASAALHPRMLAIWGTSDWLSTRSQQTWIAEVVNRVQPGSGSFVALEGIDHFFFRAASPEESYRLFKPPPGTPPGEFNPIILDTLRAWLDESVGIAA